MKYQIAEKFKSIQGEGVYAGTPMAFIRFVGCSVGKSVCSACDTDFEVQVSWRGGGEFSDLELTRWTEGYQHICLTGGEPLDQNLEDLLDAFFDRTERTTVHIETSGTKFLSPFVKRVFSAAGGSRDYETLWVCVSPKPGFIEENMLYADEVKVIMPGLGVIKHGVVQPFVRREIKVEFSPQGPRALEDTHLRWPDLNDALRWANSGKTVFIQPRNERNDVDMTNLRLCQDIVAAHPQLRLSVQLHKILKVQ